MSRVLITGAMTTAVAAGASEFVFLPEGKRKIFPLSQKAGIEVNVPAEQGVAIAAALQADLDKRLRENVEPWFDFEHTRKYPKSGYPKSFRYEKGVGIMCSAEWSRSGRIALKGKDVNHFSPEFYVDKNGVPNGLPDRGPVGGLVSEPAFRDLPAIAASAADIDPDSNDNAMSNLLILASIGLLTQEEAARDGAENLARTRVAAMRKDGEDLVALRITAGAAEKELAEIKVKVTASEEAAKLAATKKGEELFDRAVKAGAAPAKDEVAKGRYIAAAQSPDPLSFELLTEKVTAAEAKGGPAITRTIINGGNGDRVVAGGGHAIEKRANELVTAGSAKDFDAALDQISASEPDLYKDYLNSLHPA